MYQSHMGNTNADVRVLGIKVVYLLSVWLGRCNIVLETSGFSVCLKCMCFSQRKPELILISKFGEKFIVNLLFCDLFAGTFASQNFQSCEFKCCRYDTLIIILKDVFRLITSVGQRKNSESPFTELKTYHLCGSVVGHQSAESEGLRFDSPWGLRIFSLSHARSKTKNIFHYFLTELKTHHLSYF